MLLRKWHWSGLNTRKGSSWRLCLDFPELSQRLCFTSAAVSESANSIKLNAAYAKHSSPTSALELYSGFFSAQNQQIYFKIPETKFKGDNYQLSRFDFLSSVAPPTTSDGLLCISIFPHSASCMLSIIFSALEQLCQVQQCLVNNAAILVGC